VTVVNETDIDGVRCFWVDTGRPTLAASLAFRQGMADEPLNESGWLHLIEHLVLHGLGGGRLNINGSVGLHHTTFDAHGPNDLVAEHLRVLVQSLVNPDFSGLSRERDVLAAEAAMRGGATGRAMAWRYGARGPGVSHFDEPGLSRATEAALTDRAHRVFTRDNAVLVLDGPPPATMSLPLGQGTLFPIPPAVPCDDRLPAMYVDESGLVLSGVVDRSGPAMMIPPVLERMLKARLRDEAGAAYGPWSTYEAVDSDHALIVAGSDIGPKILPELAKEVMDLLNGLDESGLPEEYVQDAVDYYVQAMSDPYNAFGVAYQTAMLALADRPLMTLEERVTTIRSATAATLQDDVASFRRSLLLGIHGDAAWSDEMPRLEAPLNQPLEQGRRFRHRDWPAVVEELYVGDTAVEITSDGDARSMIYAEVEGMMAFDDGGRYLVTPDGWGLSLEPHVWQNGDVAVRLVDERVAPERTLSRPDRGLQPEPRLSPIRRWWGGILNAATHPVGIVVVCIVIAAVAIGVAIAARGAGIFVLACGVLIARLIQHHRANRRPREGDSRGAGADHHPNSAVETVSDEVASRR